MHLSDLYLWVSMLLFFQCKSLDLDRARTSFNGILDAWNKENHHNPNSQISTYLSIRLLCELQLKIYESALTGSFHFRRHRCPHHPNNVVPKNGGSCLLTEYANKYKKHPINMRQPCKPSDKPLQSDQPLEDKTTNRSVTYINNFKICVFRQHFQLITIKSS